MKAEDLSDEALYAREYELRQILDKHKTRKQMKEAMALKAEIRRRFAALDIPGGTESGSQTEV